MADTEDLKSSGVKTPCGFESRPRQQNLLESIRVLYSQLYYPSRIKFSNFKLYFGSTLAVLGQITFQNLIRKRFCACPHFALASF